MIAKSLSTSEKFASLYSVAGELAEFCQSIYPLMVAHSDDSGRQQGDTFTVKHVVLPISPRPLVEFDAALAALDRVGLIHRYDVNGRKYIEIRDFAPHQPGLKNRGNSKIPALPRPTVDCREIPPEQPESPKSKNRENSKITALPRTAADCREMPLEEKRTEEKRTEEKRAVRAEPLRDSAPVVLTFSVVGTQGTAWGLTRTLIEAWAQSYPNLDVLSECRKAQAWVHARPERRKTPRGMPAFLVNWLNRATETARPTGHQNQPARRGIEQAPAYTPWECPHVEPCDSRNTCVIRTAQQRPEKADAVR